MHSTYEFLDEKKLGLLNYNIIIYTSIYGRIIKINKKLYLSIFALIHNSVQYTQFFVLRRIYNYYYNIVALGHTYWYIPRLSTCIDNRGIYALISRNGRFFLYTSTYFFKMR